jgi:hypothetical protein
VGGPSVFASGTVTLPMVPEMAVDSLVAAKDRYDRCWSVATFFLGSVVAALAALASDVKHPLVLYFTIGICSALASAAIIVAIATHRGVSKARADLKSGNRHTYTIGASTTGWGPQPPPATQGGSPPSPTT